HSRAGDDQSTGTARGGSHLQSDARTIRGATPPMSALVHRLSWYRAGTAHHRAEGAGPRHQTRSGSCAFRELAAKARFEETTIDCRDAGLGAGAAAARNQGT